MREARLKGPERVVGISCCLDKSRHAGNQACWCIQTHWQLRHIGARTSYGGKTSNPGDYGISVPEPLERPATLAKQCFNLSGIQVEQHWHLWERIGASISQGITSSNIGVFRSNAFVLSPRSVRPARNGVTCVIGFRGVAHHHAPQAWYSSSNVPGWESLCGDTNDTYDRFNMNVRVAQSA